MPNVSNASPERTKLVRAYCEKHAALSTHAIAKALIAKHPTLFKDLDQARYAVRYARGEIGGKNNRGSIRSSREPVQRYTQPKSAATTREPFTLSPGRWLVLSDIHVPFQDDQALELAVKDGRKAGCDGLLINGDLLDFHAISRHPKEWGRPSIKEEIEMAEQVLGWLRQELRGPRLVYKHGNHDERWASYLIDKAPEVFDLCSNVFHVALGSERHGVETVADRRVVLAGALHIWHGHEVIRGLSMPVNPARGLYLKTHVSAMIGHLHRGSFHPERHADGRVVGSWSSGCLCDLSPFYATVNQWDHSYVIIDLGADGQFEVRQRRIINGRVY